MTQSIELNSVRRGYDPRDFTLVAAGGAGPLFACDIALELDIPRVLVPPNPGIIAATGLLVTDIQHEFVATERHSAREPRQGAPADPLRRALRGQAVAQLERDSVPEDRRLVRRLADCRYAGQGYEVRFDVPAGDARRRLDRRAEGGASTAPTRPSTGTVSTRRSRSSTSAWSASAASSRSSGPSSRSGDGDPSRRADAASSDVVFEVDGKPDARSPRRSTSARSCAPAIASPGRPSSSSTTRRPWCCPGSRPWSTATATSWSTAPRARSAELRPDRRPGHADPHARDRRGVLLHRQGDGRRALPHVLLVDHPRVRGPRRRASSTPTATSWRSRTRRRCSWARCRRSSRA